MGLESQDTAISRIDPSTLIGRADRTVVEPRATAMFADAFRQGVISADDVISRISALGQSKRKAEIAVNNAQAMQAGEAVSPEAQAARAAQLGATQAGAEQARLAAEKQKIYDQYPGVKYFEALAPTAFVPTPKLPNGQPDYAEIEIIGNELALDHAKKTKAFNERENIVAETQNGVVSSRTRQGASVSPTRRDELDRIINTPFSRQAPGTISGGASASPAPTGTGGQVTPAAATDVVSPRAVAPRPVIEIDGGYLAPGGTGPRDPGAVGMAAEQQKGLAQAALTTEQLKAIGSSFQNLQKDSPWLTGPVMGRLGTLVGAANWDTARADFERATTSMLANLAKGIYHETGVLSDKDIARYQKAMPSVNDTASVAQIKLAGVTRDIFNSIDTNIEIMKGQGQAINPIIQSMQGSARSELSRLNSLGGSAGNSGTTPKSAATPTKASPEEARNLPANVKTFIGNDGETYKNPNYQPGK